MKKYTVILNEDNRNHVVSVNAENEITAFRDAAQKQHDYFYSDGEEFIIEDWACIAVFEGDHENLFSTDW